jgi:hypothetical protein
MNVDWKQISASRGCRSLKTVVIKDIQKLNRHYSQKNVREREKKRIYEKFKWIIGRAFHYANIFNVTVDVILDIWENDRDYNWQNYYQSSKIPRLILSPHVAHQNPLNYYKKDKWYRNDPKRRQKKRFEYIVSEQKRLSKRQGNKRRWSSHRKKIEKKRKQSL